MGKLSITNTSPTRVFKLLFVSSRDKYPPFRADVRTLFAIELVARGHMIDWVLQSAAPCKYSYKTEWSGCQVWVGSTNCDKSASGSLARHILNIAHSFKIFQLSRTRKYDFIQIRDSIIPSFIAMISTKIYGSKFIYWLSFPFPEASIYQAKTGIANYPLFSYCRGLIGKLLLYRIILPKAHHIFVQSEQMKRNLSEMGISEEKMTPVPMGVCLSTISVQQTENFKRKKGNYVLYLGALDRMRDIDFLIRVFHRVTTTKTSNVKFFIIGGSEDPSDEERLKEQAKNFGIQNYIVFTGFLPMHEAWSYVAKADVCVSYINPIPIFNVGSPTKLIEYMAMGKPVVANHHPEQMTILSKSGGGLCVPADEKAFAEAIYGLLKNKKKAREMGIKGRRYIENYRDYEKITDIVEMKYRHITRSYFKKDYTSLVSG